MIVTVALGVLWWPLVGKQEMRGCCSAVEPTPPVRHGAMIVGGDWVGFRGWTKLKRVFEATKLD